MSTTASFKNAPSDLIAALVLVFQRNWRRNVTSWIYVPIGIFSILAVCFGVSTLINISSVAFPASVTCMILLFVGLIICDFVLGDRRTRQIVNILDIPAGFALRYINIFFTPSFVLLPLSPPISGIEVAKIIVVFPADSMEVIGFLLMMAVTAYMIRGLQALTGSSRRAVIERAEEMGSEQDVILPTNDPHQMDQSSARLSRDNISEPSFDDLTLNATRLVRLPPAVQDPASIRGTGGPPVDNPTEGHRETFDHHQTPLPLTRTQRWAAIISRDFDRLTFLSIFLFVGLPIYYSVGYAAPVQLSFNIMAYFLALMLPAAWKQFLHPVLVSSAITVLGIWSLGLVRGETLHDVLASYKTGAKYTELWKNDRNLPLPGAGDIFGSVLDASIVALALPMFQYRKELKQHFLAIVVPNFAVSIGSLFGYPALCFAIGIGSERSLAFAARSLTLALATPAVENLGGDLNTVAALAITSGILGVLLGPRILQWLGIPEDDYVTRGVTLGGNSSAIATALLLVTDPRAAALSSLSMSLFGIITLSLTSIPSVVKVVKSLVSL